MRSENDFSMDDIMEMDTPPCCVSVYIIKKWDFTSSNNILSDKANMANNDQKLL